MAIAAAGNGRIRTGLDCLRIRAILRIAGFFGVQIGSLVPLSCGARAGVGGRGILEVCQALHPIRERTAA